MAGTWVGSKLGSKDKQILGPPKVRTRVIRHKNRKTKDTDANYNKQKKKGKKCKKDAKIASF